ncbi:Uncharacterized protein dnl_63230 [Desulfonema limicola]|uniref:Uncharacterized protein n=1 Tax=Desulfonema limicola TaxID=45656 RepID=A0A975BDY0_9BACT|nr:hypothetical protein [Desulfonema limicola]QTA83899.1 Uncharacterized protein dnl_63230 [Desulfonema limicola]
MKLTFERLSSKYPPPVSLSPLPSQPGKEGKPRTETGQEIRLFPPEWLKKYDESTLERLAIMTIEGGLSDQEAENMI